MSFDSLQERLTALQETTAQVRELIDRLANLKFQPGSVPLGFGDEDDDENVVTELSTEINSLLREEEEDLELLAEEVTDLRGGKEGSEAARMKERLREGAGRLQREVKSCRVSSHKAQLAAKRSLAAAQRVERELLLQSYVKAASTPSRSGANSPGPGPGPAPSLGLRRRHTQKPGRPDDPVVAASSDLTESLRRAHKAVTDELARSIGLHENLQTSTQQLKQLGSTYGRMDDMLASSRDLVGVLMRSNKSDTWYLQTTFYMLLVTLAWLVFRRFLYGPLWWLVWLPLRLVFRTGSTAVGMVGGGPGGASMEVVGGNEGGRSKTIVDMGDNSAVPTAKVGTGIVADKGAGDPDSMIDKVGKIIDGGDQTPGADVEQPPAEAEQFVPISNGEEVPQEAGRLRDEL